LTLKTNNLKHQTKI